MRYHIQFLLLMLFGACPPTVAQTVERQQVQLRLGATLPTDSFHIYAEYPQLVPLSRGEEQALRQAGFQAEPQLQLQVNWGKSRGETIADVSYLPVVERGGKWYRVSSCEVKAAPAGPRLSPAHRLMVKKALAIEAQGRYAPQSVLAKGKWVKISVTQEGIYQFTYAELQKLGFSQPSRVRLYGYGGRLLPDLFNFTGPDALIDDLCEVPLYHQNSSVLFFAEGLLRYDSNTRFSRNTFASASCYFLTEAAEGEAPAPWTVLEAEATDGPEVDQVTAHALAEGDKFVWYGGGRDFFDTNELLGGHTYRLQLPGIVEGEYTVAYNLSAQNASAATKVSILRVNSGEIVASPTISKYGEGESAHGYRGTFQSMLKEEERFTVTTTSTGRLGYLYAAYQQQLRTDCTTAPFSADRTGPVTFRIKGATDRTRLWQLADAETGVAELPGQLSGNELTVPVPDGSRRFVCVDLSKTYPTPTVVGEVANQNLHADSCLDYIIVIPASGKLQEQAERLAQAHRDRSGLRVKVVRADQLFNEFSSGTPDAAAYRRYLKMLYDRAQSEADMPRYLLLFGDCTYDNRMVTSEWKGASPADYLLACERNDQESYNNTNYSIGTLHSYVTDDYFGFLDDGEGLRFNTEKLDLGIGRFLCHTPADAKWLVDQAIDYMDQKHAGAWTGRMWAIADTGDENLHMNDAQKVASEVTKVASPDFLIQRIFPDIYAITQEAKGATYPEATAKLKQAMQRGALIFNYNGHGSPDRISHKFLLNKDEMLANQSEARPLWLFASCEITPYDQVCEDLGRNALFSTTGPAVAVLCAARSVYANYNRSLNMGFVHFAFSRDTQGRRYTFGDALRLTKCELLKNTTASIGTDQTVNKMKYALLGDPALVLSYPDSGLRIDSVNGQPLGTATVALPIGSKVRLSGSVVGDDGQYDTDFSGTLSATVFAPLQTLNCKGAGNSKATPLVYTDYTNTLYEGTATVSKGRFAVEFVVPRGLTFSEQPGFVSLYAADSTGTRHLSGSTKQLAFNGTAPVEETDSLGPKIYLYIDRPDFVSGATVAPDATFYASLADSAGISIISGNLGHDMELWFDNDPSTLQVVNNWFSFESGSYRSGLVAYPLTGLSEGPHTLSFRAWDVMDNASTATLRFNVSAAGTPSFAVDATPRTARTATRFVTTFEVSAQGSREVRTEVFNLFGQRVWHTTTHAEAGEGFSAADWTLCDYAGTRLQGGLYLYRSVVDGKATPARRLVILSRTQ